MLARNIKRIEGKIEPDIHVHRSTPCIVDNVPSGIPPAGDEDWHYWFYGMQYDQRITIKKEDAVPPPPDIAIAINKTAEFVAKFGPRAEETLVQRDEMNMEFLAPAHVHYHYYQVRTD